MAKKKRVWKFSEGRRASLRKAQRIHVELVKLGRKARARGMK